MDREIAAAGIEQDAAFDTAIDRTDRGAVSTFMQPGDCGSPAAP